MHNNSNNLTKKKTTVNSDKGAKSKNYSNKFQCPKGPLAVHILLPI